MDNSLKITSDLENIPGPVVREIILQYASLKGEFIGTLKYFRHRVDDEQTKKVIDEQIQNLENGKQLFEGLTI